MRLRLFICLLFLSASLVSAKAQEAAWEPQQTWVFAVGALKFDRKMTFSFPNKDRADTRLLDAWRKRGVPESQIVFIKNEEATKAGIETQLVPFVQRPKAADTLIFYYTGHGGRDMNSPARPVSFATYDTRSTWTVNSIVCITRAIQTATMSSSAAVGSSCVSGVICW